MATSPMADFIQHLRRSMLLRDGAGKADGELLDDFLSRRNGAALEALVHRHGPMVWGVCRRILPDHHDAEDAFQATFLVLARRAATIGSKELIANWLYGVARQTALKARAMGGKRRGREKQVAVMPDIHAAEQPLWRDLQPVLDEELSRLPDKYRAVLVLCDLEGVTRKEAARQIGCPEGTVAGRLARARAMLAGRLTQRGVVLSSGLLAAVLAHGAAAAGVPAAVVLSTVRAVSLLTASRAAGLISARVAALMEGVLKAMLATKIKTVTTVMAAVGMATLAYAMLAGAEAGEEGKGRGTASLAVREGKPVLPPPPELPKGAGLVKDGGKEDVGEYKELRGQWRVVWEDVNNVFKGKGLQKKEGPVIWTLKGVKSPERAKADGVGDVVYFQLGPDAKRPGKGEVASFALLLPFTLDPPDPRATNHWITMPGVYGWVGEGRLRVCFPLTESDETAKLPMKLMDRGAKGYASCELERVKEEKPEGKGKAAQATEEAGEEDVGEYKALRGRWLAVVADPGGKEPVVWTLKAVRSPEQAKVKAEDGVYCFQLGSEAKRPGKDETAPFTLYIPLAANPADPKSTPRLMTKAGSYQWVGENRVVFRFPVSGDKLPSIPAGATVGGSVEYYSFEMERVTEERPQGRPEKQGTGKTTTPKEERLKLPFNSVLGLWW